LADCNLAPHRLLLELTESVVLQAGTWASSALGMLRRHGIRVAIDDFGTGYSSLAYLRELSVDVIKIDRSFVHQVDADADHQTLIRAILALADGLAVATIVEGVETDAELDTLAALGCSALQGFLFSRPLDADSFRELLAAGPLRHRSPAIRP
jgi:EAL domain-containing protein (putative c-di-GMP-specific phosphodiesterase class I)